MTMTDVDVDAEQGAQLSFTFATKQFQREVGVAVRSPRPRQKQGERLRWRIQVFYFLDSPQFANLEALLIQHAPTVVCMPETAKGSGGEAVSGAAAADTKRLRDLFETHAIPRVEEMRRGLFSQTSLEDLEGVLPRLLGEENIAAHRGTLGAGKVLVQVRKVCEYLTLVIMHLHE
jgi:hypothetical protein